MARYTEDNVIQQLAGRAEQMLEAYGQAPSMRERCRNLARRAAGRSVPEQDVIFWPAGMLLLGLVEAGRIDACRAYVDAWIAEGSIVRHTDDALAGYVFLRLYEATGETAYKDAADAVYQFLLQARTDSKGAIVYNAARENSYVFADGVGQAAMFLSHYGTVFARAEALALAAMQISLFSQYGMDAATGLPYHAYEASSRTRLGIIGWGRAAGWLLLGTSQYVADCASRQQAGEGTIDADTEFHGAARLANTDCARDAAVMAIHRSLVDAVQNYVRKDGTYSWLLPASEGPQDSSASGMIAYSVVKSLRAGNVDGDTENMIADTAMALSDFVNGDRVYGCSAECIDIGEYRQQYGCYPWGQGAVLAALAIS